MTIKRTLRELAEIMVSNGVEPERVKSILLDLGFSKEKVEEVVAHYALISSNGKHSKDENSPESIGKTVEKLVIEEELRRQREELQRLEEDLMKIMVDLNNLKKKIKVLESSKATRALEQEVRELEAKLDALVDVIIDNAPQLLASLRERGLTK